MSARVDEVVIIDFETTGLSENYERVIEVGAAIVRGERITKTFATLCNPGIKIPSYITDITGITNQMIADHPRTEEAMPLLKKFIGERVILAHNASFDSQFLHAEMDRANIEVDNHILCTLLLSRRLIQNAENYKLGTLKRHINFKAKKDHKDHRALDDVKVTAALWCHLRKKVAQLSGIRQLDIGLYKKISRMPKAQVASKLAKLNRNEQTEC